MKTESLAWYPMRVTYSRELKVKDCLDSMGIEDFIPMCKKVMTTTEGERAETLEPAVHNLIFIHSTISVINELKHKNRLLSSLRYMVHRNLFVEGAKDEILSVSDKEMDIFMRVTKRGDEEFVYLKYEDYIAEPGQHVVVTDGPFAGVEGKVKRIHTNKKVVVELRGVLAVALAYIPTKYIKICPDEEPAVEEKLKRNA
jgi:transcription antitermination factor NusG